MDGIGPISAAAMLGFFNFNRCCCQSYSMFKQKAIPAEHKDKCPGVPYSSKFISYSGMADPKKYSWGAGHVRPYNQQLKTVFFNIGVSIEKLAPRFRLQGMDSKSMAEALLREHHVRCEEEGTQPTLTWDKVYAEAQEEVAKHGDKVKKMARETGLYVRWFYQARLEETRRNEAGENAAYAARKLEERKGSPTAGMIQTWKKGKIQDCAVRYRAIRRVANILINNFFEVGKEVFHGIPCGTIRPYVLTLDGHTQYVPPPNWPID
jgi:hypothetical protein